MQDSDSLGRNGKSEGISESFFFLKNGPYGWKRGKKSKANNSKEETYSVFLIFNNYLF